MDYNQFKNLLSLKDIGNKESVRMLEELIEKYPYFQTARALLAKSLHEQQSIHYDEALKIAAAYSPDRKVLQELIEAPPPPEGGGITRSTPSKTAVVLESPPRRIEEAVLPPTATATFTEWYSEDEISGKAFEEQDKKEKIIDPHKIIQQRLSEILTAPVQAKEELTQTGSSASIESKQAGQIKAEERQPEKININKPEVTPEYHSQVTYEEPSTDQDFGKTEPEEVSVTTGNRGEEIILEEAAKAHDILDRMEIEHALEESILSSLEKLPVISEGKTSPPIPSLKSEQIKFTPEIIIPDEEPVKADTSKPRSFTEWMNAISPKSFNRFEEVHLTENSYPADNKIEDHNLDQGIEDEIHQSHPEEVSEDALIDKFIATQPKIIPSKAEFYSPISQAKKSLIEHEDIITETLARIYTGQGHYAKARWCYEKLSLLYPEKSSYFAALLKELEQKEKEVK